ncbi:hypothetical protein ACKKBG_A04880 [Auxenochlorella protothecoides x Auxenochlorella symbiontica]
MFSGRRQWDRPSGNNRSSRKMLCPCRRLLNSPTMQSHLTSTVSRVERVVESRGEDYWLLTLNTEFGGMNEVLYNLFSETGRREYADCARRFDKPAFLEPLLQGRDPLPGLHANTHLAQVNGFAARYDSMGDKAGATAVHNFFALLEKYHSFATGGSNWREFWFNESTVADAINDPDSGAVSQESCTQYNMLKIARRMFTWSGSPAMADYYELAMQNGVLGIQRKPHSHDDQHDHLHEHHQHHAHLHQRQHQHHLGLGREQVQEVPEQGRPASSDSLTAAMTAVYETQPRPADHQVVSWPQDPGAMLQSSTGLATNAAGPGVMIYYLPQFAGEWKGERGHSWTGWGDPYNAFWCCYGSGVESFSKLADSIYFHRTVNASAAAGVAAAAADAPPELFVNQLVTSSLEWKQQGVVVNQTADMYGPESAARARLVITTADEAGTAHFVLKWRIPAWTDPAAALVKVDGRNASCVPPAPVEGVADSGAQAFYCDLGPEWKSGDVVESFFPFKSRVESINDQRPENSRLKAVLVGPWVMAGVTDGKRNITADPRSIDTLLSMPSSADLVSLRPFTLEGGTQNEGPILLTRHAANATLLAAPHPQSSSRAAAMDATFRLVPGADGACSDGSQGVEGVPLLTPGRCVSLEPMAHPGQRLRQQHDGSLTVVAGAGAGVPPSVFTVAACSEPGNLCLLGASAGDKAGASPSIHLLAPAAPQYPLGSRVLKGLDSQYLLVPIGQIIDEHYTTYFEFLDPPAAVSM